jgi:regulator of sigma D
MQQETTLDEMMTDYPQGVFGELRNNRYDDYVALITNMSTGKKAVYQAITALHLGNPFKKAEQKHYAKLENSVQQLQKKFNDSANTGIIDKNQMQQFTEYLHEMKQSIHMPIIKTGYRGPQQVL